MENKRRFKIDRKEQKSIKVSEFGYQCPPGAECPLCNPVRGTHGVAQLFERQTRNQEAEMILFKKETITNGFLFTPRFDNSGNEIGFSVRKAPETESTHHSIGQNVRR